MSRPWASAVKAMQPTPASSRTSSRLPLALDPAVEHRVRRLVDQHRRAQVAQDLRRGERVLRGVGRHPDVERLARADGRVERAHRLLERRVGVRAVVVEDVDVVEAEALERLVEARRQVLARAEVAVRAGPHVPAGLGRDDELVAVGLEVLGQDAPGVGLGRAVRRAVVVRQVEVVHAEVEGAAHDRALGLDRLVVAEVVPEAERDGGQLEPAHPAAAVGLDVVAVLVRGVGHDRELTKS